LKVFFFGSLSIRDTGSFGRAKHIRARALLRRRASR
jgi:hypothetical protein